jgi:hypothetical protein
MNRVQMTILLVMAAVLILMLLWSPFHYVGPHGIVQGRGFSYILSPPDERDSVDTTLLAIELGVCLIVGTLLYSTASAKK